MPHKKKYPGAAGTARGAKGTSNDSALNTGASASSKGRTRRRAVRP